MEKYNFKINPKEKTVCLTVSRAIFPSQVVLHAAYHFIEEAKLVVEGDEKTITVTFIPEKRNSLTELEELAYEFNLQLVTSFLENVEAERYAELREEMMRRAVFPPPAPPQPSSPPPPGKAEKK